MNHIDGNKTNESETRNCVTSAPFPLVLSYLPIKEYFWIALKNKISKTFYM